MLQLLQLLLRRVPNRDKSGWRVCKKGQDDCLGWEQDQEKEQQPARRNGVVKTVAVHPVGRWMSTKVQLMCKDLSVTCKFCKLLSHY